MELYKRKRKLYWVTTKDNCEDWFIIASRPKIASSYHESYEGFEIGAAKATEVMSVDKIYSNEKVYHAQLWMLADMGFKIISESPIRVVFKDGKLYKERTTIGAVMYENVSGKEGVYILRVSGTDQYKIGITKDVEKRLKNLQTGNPHPIELYAFYPTKYYKNLEKKVHKICKDRSIGGEWFSLSIEETESVHTFMIKESKRYYGYTGLSPRLILGEY